MKTLPDLPPEVIQQHLCKFLSYNDLLRCREVCKFVKLSVDEHSRVARRKTQKEIVIHTDNEHSNSIASFMDITPIIRKTIQRVYIAADINSNHEFDRPDETWFSWFESDDVKLFVEKHCNDLTHLKVAYMELPFWRHSEVQFYNGFKNLHSLECDRIDASNYEGRQENLHLPTPFKILKELILPVVHTDYFRNGLLQNINLFWRFFNQTSDKLVYFVHPKFPDAYQVDLATSEPCGAFSWIRNLIERRPTYDNLQFYDLKYFEEEAIEDQSHIDHFTALCESCFRSGVKLKNVDSRLLMNADITDYFKEAVAATVISMQKWIDFRVFEYNLQSLESVSFKTRYCVLPDMATLRRSPPIWPQLQYITVEVNRSDDDEENYTIEQIEHNISVASEKLVFVLFGQIRSHVKELCMKWDISLGDVIHDYKISSPQIFVRSVPNLTKLELSGCLEYDTFFLTLWDNLPLLKTIRINECFNLSDFGFIGDNSCEPFFFRLKYLKDLKLEGLHRMPRVTDSLFHTVIRHVPLRCLKLSSFHIPDGPRLTTAAIETLTTSLLAKSIEKLHLEISYYSDQDMANIASLLRPLPRISSICT